MSAKSALNEEWRLYVTQTVLLARLCANEMKSAKLDDCSKQFKPKYILLKLPLFFTPPVFFGPDLHVCKQMPKDRVCFRAIKSLLEDVPQLGLVMGTKGQ